MNNINIKTESGKCIGILGSNGCGKSTLLSILAGINKPDSGSFLIDGRDMLSLGLIGRDIGTALDELLKAVIEEKCPNDKESLLSYYQNNVKSV